MTGTLNAANLKLCVWRALGASPNFSQSKFLTIRQWLGGGKRKLAIDKWQVSLYDDRTGRQMNCLVVKPCVKSTSIPFAARLGLGPGSGAGV